MGVEQQRLTNLERANLVAYLDGELTEPESQLLATKLTNSVSARREVEALERTWDLLDVLPRPKTPPEFTQRTITQAQGQATLDDRLVGLAGRTLQGATRLAILVGSAALVLVVAYALTRWAWPDRSARLVRDLSIAEHLDEYRKVGSFDFLKQLDDEPAFNEEGR